jgi:uncharacterized damage-inducible protein DinB
MFSPAIILTRISLILMANTLSTLEKLAAYNYWANNRLLQHLENIHAEIPDTTLQLLSHVVNTQAIWLSRIENKPIALMPFDTHTLAQCRELHGASSQQLQTLAALTQPELAAEVNYTNTKGEGFTNSIHDILTHVFNHSTYHRAQIARDLRQNNLEPINTDYIFYVRNI